MSSKKKWVFKWAGSALNRRGIKPSAMISLFFSDEVVRNVLGGIRAEEAGAIVLGGQNPWHELYSVASSPPLHSSSSADWLPIFWEGVY